MQPIRKKDIIESIIKYCPRVALNDFPIPIYHEQDSRYHWHCPCGSYIIMDKIKEIWNLIYFHITELYHDEWIASQQFLLTAKINELNNQLSPATLDELEPQIHKLTAKYDIVSKWRRICSPYANDGKRISG
jgi:hypothetical protein